MKNTPGFLLAAALAIGAPHASGQAGKYPAKPVRLVVSFSAGSQTDSLARLIGQKLTQSLGQQVVVDNRAGAGGMLAMQIVAGSLPDGHSLLFHSSGYSIGPHLYPRMKLDLARDLQAVSLVASTPHVLVVPPQLGPRTLKDFVDYARARGDLNWSHAGMGSSTHLVGEKFMLEAKLTHTGIPYKGAPEALTDTIGMRVALFFAAVGHAAPFIHDGRVLGLAVTGKERSPAIPNVPTVAETMLPGFEYDVWFLVAAPAKTPKAIIDRLSADMRLGLGAADFRSALDAMGSVARPTTPAEAQAYALKEFDTLGKVIKAARVPVN